MLSFNDTNESKLWITGCLHAFHKQPFIWSKRKYDSPEEHTQGLINIINKYCSKNDNLLILGDITLNASEDDFLNFINALNPTIHHCWGNHNAPHRKMFLDFCTNKFEYEVIGYKWLDKITSWGHYLEFRWNKHYYVIANHYPFYVFNHMHRDKVWSLCSHSHGSCKLSQPSDTTMKQLDCGWDLWYKPLNFSEIKEIMEKKLMAIHDHHNKDNIK